MTTENKLNVYQKLQKARIALQRANIKKSGKNAYAGFTYFELKDFIPTINELFDKYGLTSNFSIENELAQLTIVNTDNISECVQFTSPIAEANLKGCTPIQALGAVHTYMKRYLYLNAFEIVEDDLLDAKAGTIETKSIDDKVIAEINKISTISELNSFYETNKKDVENLKKFQAAYSARAKEITAA